MDMSKFALNQHVKPLIDSVNLHDPHTRCLLFSGAEWEIRGYAYNDPRHAYCAPRGFLHLQLWCPNKNISILTPSQVTSGLYLVHKSDFTQYFKCYRALLHAMSNERSALLCSSVVAHFELWFVRSFEVGASLSPQQNDYPL